MPRKAAVALWNLGGENIKEMKDCTPREERVLSDEGCGLLLQFCWDATVVLARCRWVFEDLLCGPRSLDFELGDQRPGLLHREAGTSWREEGAPSLPFRLLSQLLCIGTPPQISLPRLLEWALHLSFILFLLSLSWITSRWLLLFHINETAVTKVPPILFDTTLCMN